MKEIGYYDGEIGLLSEMKVPMLDRALYFGDGVYDVAFAYNQKIFTLEDHLDRFYHSMELMDMHFHLTREELSQELYKCLQAAESNDLLMLYWQSSRGAAKRSHVFPKDVHPSLMIMVTQMKALNYKEPLKLITQEDTRFFHCNIKTLNLIPNVMAAQAAEEAGCTEAILHRQDQLTECAHSSLLILKDGKLIGPELNELILPSITRKHAFSLAEQLGIPSEVRKVTMDEVWNADEVLVLSTGKLIAQADTLDGKKIGMKDPVLCHKLQDAYFDWVKKETGYTADE